MSDRTHGLFGHSSGIGRDRILRPGCSTDRAMRSIACLGPNRSPEREAGAVALNDVDLSIAAVAES